MAGDGFILLCLMVLLFLVYTLSSAAKCYIKLTTYTIISIFAASVPIPLMLLKPRSPKNALIPAWCLRQAARLIGISWEVRGMENIDNSRGTVVLMNHQSAIDLTVLAILWPIMERSTVVSKKAIFWIWPFGLAAWLWGTVYINRSKRGEAMTSINQQAEAVRKRKAKLLLFPEATRNTKPELLPFKKGAFHASLQAEAPIQPVVVSKYHFYDHDKKVFNEGHFILTILPLIETTGYNKDNVDELIDRTRNVMQSTFTETSNEIFILNSKSRLDKAKCS